MSQKHQLGVAGPPPYPTLLSGRDCSLANAAAILPFALSAAIFPRIHFFEEAFAYWSPTNFHAECPEALAVRRADHH